MSQIITIKMNNIKNIAKHMRYFLLFVFMAWSSFLYAGENKTDTVSISGVASQFDSVGKILAHISGRMSIGTKGESHFFLKSHREYFKPDI